MTTQVYAAINAVQEALSKTGVAKNQKNAQQGYKFRGIDDVYAALAPLLAQHKLCVLPEVIERSCEERQTKNGGTLFYVTLKVAFDFVSAEDASKHRIVTVGEAMDSGDKAASKAQSTAYKYAAFMAFCIPTEGDNDIENQTHEVAPKNDELVARCKAFADAAEIAPDLATLESHINAHKGLLFDVLKKNPPYHARLSEIINNRRAELT